MGTGTVVTTVATATVTQAIRTAVTTLPITLDTDTVATITADTEVMEGTVVTDTEDTVGITAVNTAGITIKLLTL